MKIKKIVLSSILSALSFVLYEFMSIGIPPTNSPLIKLSLGIIPIFFICYYAGIYYGIVSAVIVDLLGYFLVGVNNGYAFNIGYTINAFIGALLIGLTLRYKDKLNGKLGNKIILVIVLLMSLLTIPIFNIFLPIEYQDKALVISLIGLSLNIVSYLYTLIFRKVEDSNAINISYLLYQYVVSLFLTPLWISMMTKTTSYFYLWLTRLYTVPITFIIYSVLTKIILIPIKRIYKNEYSKS